MKAIQAWAEGRLTLTALDQTELPPGLRDLKVIDLSIDRDQGIKHIVELVEGDADLPEMAQMLPAVLERLEHRIQSDFPRAVAPASHQVFVSYSRDDWNIVARIVRQIEGFGYKVWVDGEDKSGGRFAGAIVRAIRSGRVIALTASSNSLASDHVVREVYVAGDNKIPFVRVLLGQSDFPDDFVYFLSGFPRTGLTALQPECLKSQLSRYIVWVLTALFQRRSAQRQKYAVSFTVHSNQYNIVQIPHSITADCQQYACSFT